MSEHYSMDEVLHELKAENAQLRAERQQAIDALRRERERHRSLGRNADVLRLDAALLGLGEQP